jgi:hypothetical protein
MSDDIKNNMPRPEDLERKFKSLSMEKNFIPFDQAMTRKVTTLEEENTPVEEFSSFPWSKYEVHTPEDL